MSDRKYLGEFDVDISQTPYANYTPNDWAMEYLFRFSQIDGSHHKAWTLDQVARILKGTKVIVKVAKWDDGLEEYRFWTEEQHHQEYLDWIKKYQGNCLKTKYYEEWEYSWDEGIAP